MTEGILRKVHKFSFKYNFKLLTAMNFFYTHQKCFLTLAYQVEVINYISKNIFTKNYAIHLILFICARVCKLFLPFPKINLKSSAKKSRASNRRT